MLQGPSGCRIGKGFGGSAHAANDGLSWCCVGRTNSHALDPFVRFLLARFILACVPRDSLLTLRCSCAASPRSKRWFDFTTFFFFCRTSSIPCAWWTCDWGEYDGAGIRGGIWLLGGAIAAFFLCKRLSRPCVVLECTDDEGNARRVEIALHRDDAKAAELIRSINAALG